MAAASIASPGWVVKLRPLGCTVMVKLIDSVSCRDRCLIQSP
jgi:hypothetical protein